MTPSEIAKREAELTEEYYRLEELAGKLQEIMTPEEAGEMAREMLKREKK
jgi:hypothetical protein